MKRFFLSLILVLALLAVPASTQVAQMLGVAVNVEEGLVLEVAFSTLTFDPGPPDGSWILATEGPLGVTCAISYVGDVYLKAIGQTMVVGPGDPIQWDQFAITGTGDFTFPKLIFVSGTALLHTFTSSGSYTGTLDFEYLNLNATPGTYAGQIKLILTITP